MSEQTIVYLSNIDFYTTEEELGSLFEEFKLYVF